MYTVTNTALFLIVRLLLLRYNYMFRLSLLAIFRLYMKLNARHPDVLLKTIKIYKYRQNTTKFIILYGFWTTCFDSLESSSGPLVN